MTRDFNIRDNNWNPAYLYQSIYADILREIAVSFNLELSIPIIQVPTRYVDNSRDFNSVINLMFLQTDSEEFDTHTILLDLHSPSNHASLSVNIIIREEFI